MDPELVYIFRVLVAVLCGGLIGLGREKNGKRAGLRTHIIIAATSALMMLISKYGFSDVEELTRVDASRLAASVIASIGFLGIGVIRSTEKGTEGLTTSAGLLAPWPSDWLWGPGCMCWQPSPRCSSPCWNGYPTRRSEAPLRQQKPAPACSAGAGYFYGITCLPFPSGRPCG